MEVLKLAKLKVEHQKEVSAYKKMHEAIQKFNKMKKEAKLKAQPFPLEEKHIFHMRTQVFRQINKIKAIESQMNTVRQSVSFTVMKLVDRYGTVALASFIMGLLTLIYIAL